MKWSFRDKYATKNQQQKQQKKRKREKTWSQYQSEVNILIWEIEIEKELFNLISRKNIIKIYNFFVSHLSQIILKWDKEN